MKKMICKLVTYNSAIDNFFTKFSEKMCKRNAKKGDIIGIAFPNIGTGTYTFKPLESEDIYIVEKKDLTFF